VDLLPGFPDIDICRCANPEKKDIDGLVKFGKSIPAFTS
jgi:hypothetical protein